MSLMKAKFYKTIATLLLLSLSCTAVEIPESSVRGLGQYYPYLESECEAGLHGFIMKYYRDDEITSNESWNDVSGLSDEYDFPNCNSTSSDTAETTSHEETFTCTVSIEGSGGLSLTCKKMVEGEIGTKLGATVTYTHKCSLAAKTITIPGCRIRKGLVIMRYKHIDATVVSKYSSTKTIWEGLCEHAGMSAKATSGTYTSDGSHDNYKQTRTSHENQITEKCEGQN